MARTRSTEAHNRVLEAALELFVEKGIEPTTMDALAAASGVSKATIYKHWPEGKEPLLMELLLVVVGIEDEIPEQDTGNLFTDLERVLNDKPRHARPEDQKRLMPQMVAYSATHQEFGNAWRTRVMERPRKRIRRIVSAAVSDGRLPSTMDMNVCFALLLGPMMYKHIFGRHMETPNENGRTDQSILGTAKTIVRAASEAAPEDSQAGPELGTCVAETFAAPTRFDLPDQERSAISTRRGDPIRGRLIPAEFMRQNRFIAMTFLSAGAAALLTIAIVGLRAQGQGGRMAEALFTALDADKDGTLTRSELESGFSSWFTAWDTAHGGTLAQPEILAGISALLPAPPAVKPGQANTFNPAGNSTPVPVPQAAVDAMMAALPTTPGAKPMHERRVLVMAHTGAGGFVHASIPLAAKAVEALGNQGGLWTTTVSYDAADINTDNLKKYDAIFLDSTTACFLDDPDPSVTAARRAAFLSFVRGGKGIAGIHAATDSYHTDCLAGEAAAKNGTPGLDLGALVLASRFVSAADKDNDGTVSQKEWAALADDWFQKLDTGNTGKVARADFVAHFNSLLPPPDMHRLNLESKPVQQWPEFNKLIGGYFKFHWPDPQVIEVKIDDPNSPLTAMFHGQEFEIHDETYTFVQESFSRKNVHVLTSIDYDKMSAEDKAKESKPRTDGDYALSYIRREGKGRVFYEGHGHSDRVYAMTPMLEHLRAGIQYALGDLKADDSPSVK